MPRDLAVQSLVATEFRALADVLQDLQDDAWGRPSLCTRWSISEVIAHVNHGGSHQAFGAEIEDRRFQATDVDWDWGDGEPITGTAEDLILAITGRDVPGSTLSGPTLQRTS